MTCGIHSPNGAILAGVAKVLAVGLLVTQQAAQGQDTSAAASAFSFDSLRQRAAELAKTAYRPRESSIPDVLAKLDYDQYQVLRFRPDSGPWHQDQLRLDIGYFLAGFIFRDAVKIHLLENGQMRDVKPAANMFDPGKHSTLTLPQNLELAGFKVLYHQETPPKWDEAGSFLGASYFRLVGMRQHYGASGRALALDTGESAGEEFPKTR